MQSTHTHTHTHYMVTFSFNLMAKECVIANLFLLTKNDIIVCYNKFPNLGIYHIIPNLKGPSTPSQNCKKKKKKTEKGFFNFFFFY